MKKLWNLPIVNFMPFSDAVESHMGHGLPHGDFESALKACNIPLDRIPPEVVKRTLAELPACYEKHGLAFGLAHTLGR